MAQVPYTGVPQVQPNLAPTPTEHIDAPLAAFGGAVAAATERAGRTGQEVGNELYSRAIAMQELDRQAAAANAVANFTDKVGDRDVQYRSLEGKAAVDGYPQYKEDIDKIRQDIGSNLGDPYSQRVYLQESRNIQSRAVIGAGIHAGDQFKKYQIGTAQAVIDSGRKSVASNPEDDDLYNQQLKTNATKADDLQALHGWTKEQRDDFETKANSGLVFDRAQALARSDPVQARKILDAAVKDGKITGEDAGRAGDFIRNHNINVTSRVQSSAMLNGEGYHFGEGKVSVDRLYDAITKNEGGGNYDPPHPNVTHIVNGQKITEHALGIGGVMQSNLQPWLKEAGMPAMSEDEFIHDHAAQDQLVKFKLNQYQDQTGSANKAALKWFTGNPNADLSASDGGSTAGQYLQRLNSHLARNASSSDLDAISSKRANELIPNDSEFQLHFQYHVQAEHSKAKQLFNQEENDRRNTIAGAIAPGPDGKLVTSIDEVKDPAVHDAWNKLSDQDRAKYSRVLAQNAKGDYAATPQNQADFRQWWGRINDPQASDDDRKKALDQEFATMPMPWSDRKMLMEGQKKLFANTQKNPALGHAMEVLGPMLSDAGINKKNAEDYYQFLGTLHTVMQQKIEDEGKLPKDEDIKTIGAGLLRQQTVKGWLWDSKEPAYKSEVPEDERPKIIARYQSAKGFPPTDKEIQQIYAAAVYNQFYTKQKSEK